MTTTATERPLTYATEEEARAYVAALAGRARGRARGGTVYLIARPGAESGSLTAARAAVRPLQLVTFHDLFTSDARTQAADRAAVIAGRCAGALVMPASAPAGPWCGDAAVTEARALTAAGVPVLVLTPRGPVAWADCRVTAVPSGKRWQKRHSVEVPQVPADLRRVPVLAVCLRVLGIRT